MEQNDFIKGALIGGILGGIAALLLASKSGKDLRDNISDTCESVSEQSRDFVDSFKDQGQKLVDSFNGIDNSHSNNTMLVGGAIGSVIGVVAALLLAPQTGSKLRSQLGDKYNEIHDQAEKAIKGFDKTRHNIEDKFENWKDIFLTLVDKLSHTSKGSGKHSSNDLADWAAFGLRLYDQFQKGR